MAQIFNFLVNNNRLLSTYLLSNRGVKNLREITFTLQQQQAVVKYSWEKLKFCARRSFLKWRHP